MVLLFPTTFVSVREGSQQAKHAQPPSAIVLAGDSAQSARISANAGVVQQRRRCWLSAKSLKINTAFDAGVARSALQNRGLQVRVLPGLSSVLHQKLQHRRVVVRRIV